MAELNCSDSIASSSSFYDETRLKCKFQQFLIKLQSAITNHKIDDVFFKSVSLGIDRLCKYKNLFPNSVDELATKILDLLVQARARQSKFFSIEQKTAYDHCIEDISKPLIYLLTLKLSNLQNKLAFLQNWILLISSVNDLGCIQRLLIKNDSIVKCLLDYIFQSGNYTVQFFTLRLLIMHLKSNHPSTQSAILDRIFNSDLRELGEILLNFGTNLDLDFDGQYRKFLNTFNLRLSNNCRVYSCSPIRAELGVVTISNQNNFWVNFNSETSSVSFFLSPKALDITDDLNTDLIMCDYNIKTLKFWKSNFEVIIETAGKANIIPTSAYNLLELNSRKLVFQFSSADFFFIQRSKCTKLIECEKIQEPFVDCSSDSDKENIYLKTIQKRSTERPINKYKTARHNKDFVAETASSDYEDENKNHNELIIDGTSSCVSKEDKRNLKQVFKKKPTKHILQEKERVLQTQKSVTSNIHCSDQIVSFKFPGDKLLLTAFDPQKNNMGKTKSLNKTKNLLTTEVTDNKIQKKIDSSKNLKENINEPIKLNHTYSLRNRQSIKKPNCLSHSEENKFFGRSTTEINTNDLKTKRIEDKNEKRLRISSVDSLGLNSERLVNLVRPLQIFGEEPTKSSDKQAQVQLAIEEYSINHGIVGASALLNEPSLREKYTTEQLNNAAKNIKKLHSSFELSAKKFFKNNESKETVYDLENVFKDCKKSKSIRSVQKRNTKSRSQNKVSLNISSKSLKPLKQTPNKISDRKNKNQRKEAICRSEDSTEPKVLNEKTLSKKEKINLSKIQNNKESEQKNVGMVHKCKDKSNLPSETEIEDQNLNNSKQFDVLKVSETYNMKITDPKTKIKVISQPDVIDLTLKKVAKNSYNTSKISSRNLKEKIHGLKAMLSQPVDKTNLDSPNLSCCNEITIDTSNLPSPTNSDKLGNVPSTLPSSYVIELDVSETSIKTPAVIQKKWLLEKFFNDVKIYTKQSKDKFVTEEKENEVGEENENEVGEENENEVEEENEMEVEEENEMEVEEENEIEVGQENKNEVGEDNEKEVEENKIEIGEEKNDIEEEDNEMEEEEECETEFEEQEEENKNESFQSFTSSGSVIDVLRHTSNHFKNVEISSLTKEIQVHYSASIIDEKEFYERQEIESDNKLKEINLNRTFIIEDDFNSCGQSNETIKSKCEIFESNDEKLNDTEIIKNISLETSQGRRSVMSMPPISLSPILINSNDIDINQSETFGANMDDCTTGTEISRLVKRKIMENKPPFEFKKLKSIRLSTEKCDEAGETVEAHTNGKRVNDFLIAYKEKLYEKAKEINGKYEKKIFMDDLEKNQENVDKHFQSIEDIKKSLEVNKLSIFDLKSKLQEKEDEFKQLIYKRNEHFEQIRNIFAGIDEFYETNKDNFELEYKKSKNELLQSSLVIRNELWQNHLDQIINKFVQSLGRHYNFDSENSDLHNLQNI